MAEEAAAQEVQQSTDDAPGGDEPVPDALAVDEAAAAIARVAERAAGADDMGAPEARAPANVQYAQAASVEPLAAQAVAGASPGKRYEAARPADAVPPGAIAPERFYELDYDEVLQAMVACVVQQEGPVLDAVLARRIARAHGFQRTGNRIQERVERIAWVIHPRMFQFFVQSHNSTNKRNILPYASRHPHAACPLAGPPERDGARQRP